MPPKLHSQDLLDPSQRKALGTFAAEFALLEAYIATTIWGILGLNRKDGLSVTADLPTLKSINLLSSVGKLKFEDDKPEAWEKLKSLVNEMMNQNTQRNRLLHNPWFFDSRDQLLRAKFITTRNGKLQETSLELSESELLEHIQTVSEISDALLKFQEDFGVSPIPPETK
jgi:hypothetical protein